MFRREMRQSMKKFLLLVLFTATSVPAQTKTLFYMTDYPDSVRDFRYNLAGEEHLQGICAWVLGQEDNAIWSVLPDRK
jgi:spore germination protein YaaH